MPDLIFECPQCHNSLAAPEEMQGTTTVCQMCQAKVQVPIRVQAPVTVSNMGKNGRIRRWATKIAGNPYSKIVVAIFLIVGIQIVGDRVRKKFDTPDPEKSCLTKQQEIIMGTLKEHRSEGVSGYLAVGEKAGITKEGFRTLTYPATMGSLQQQVEFNAKYTLVKNIEKALTRGETGDAIEARDARAIAELDTVTDKISVTHSIDIIKVDQTVMEGYYQLPTPRYPAGAQLVPTSRDE